MALCSDASGWAKASLVCLIIGLFMHVAGWATLEWMVYSTTNDVLSYRIGLWQMTSCNSGSCETITTPDTFVTGLFQGVRAMETMVFIAALFTTILSGVYVLFESARTRNLAIALMSLCVLTAVFSFIGMILFLAYFPEPYVVSYSMGLTVLAMLLILIAGAFMIPDVTDVKRHDPLPDEQ
ncbi:hypothetical protein LOTGIDRAFT_230597 [Lottia gigantea]|uniref:Uncharacterized protein n=1 Tax=Lottia gigantea TaxID=225164 RepID=V4AB32_LOTGI|nr:hypothetical protein LOTGIDRAFT_230597 [Lottia gigantea]ESP01209.1 hypothetical protein LOTGIDRAFT_230597 [Lottia gigantea]